MTDYVVRPFSRRDLFALLADGVAEGGQQPDFNEGTLRVMETSNSWTLLADGKVTICGGTFVLWPGRHQGWTYLNAHTGRHMLSTTRKVKELMKLAGPGRIEMTVRADFTKGHRWAKMIGFEVETPVLRAFGPEGEDHVGYVKFQG